MFLWHFDVLLCKKQPCNGFVLSFIKLWIRKPHSRKSITGWLRFVTGISKCWKGGSDNCSITFSVNGADFSGWARWSLSCRWEPARCSVLRSPRDSRLPRAITVSSVDRWRCGSMTPCSSKALLKWTAFWELASEMQMTFPREISKFWFTVEHRMEV